MKRTILLLLPVLLLISCGKKTEVTASFDVIPLPQEVEVKGGDHFVLSSSTKIVYSAGDEEMKRVADFLSEYVYFATDQKLAVVDSENAPENNVIVLKTTLENANKEAYEIEVDEDEIKIEGASASGLFYGVQTLRKAIGAGGPNATVYIPQVEVKDYPRFGYRGMHLDVARHMYPAEFIKKYIDILALHNMNRFHWHLTDDQGWRIEIKKHPKLTEIGSIRKETVIGKNTGEYDGKEYGGFYTQEEIKDIVQYAADRFITIIPEIDLPGHMMGALEAYPHLGCTGGPYAVWPKWGISQEVLCPGNEDIYPFLADVLNEVMDLFPSELIHVGGDECPKSRWEECPKCQAKIKELGLVSDREHTAEERLQSHVIHFANDVITERGRKIIGWDEILEGGLPPNSTVMAWRGIEYGIEAAKLGHDVVMVPTSYAYFDYYQTRDVENVPFAIGNYLPLERVYSLEPQPEELTAEEKKHILGAQANLWTEYIPTSDHAEYMLLPRIDAISEVQWTLPSKKNYDNFIKRLLKQLLYYDKAGINYSPSAFDVESNVVGKTGAEGIEVSFKTIDNAPVHYTLDGKEPTANSPLYDGKLLIKEDAQLKATAIRPNMKSALFEQDFYFNKATLKPIKVKQETHPRYKNGAPASLVDGVRGTRVHTRNHTWIGYSGKGPIEAVIDLEEASEISEVGFATFVDTGDWIFGATGVEVLVSEDGETFTSVATARYEEPTERTKEVVNIDVTFEPTEARYVKILIDKTDNIPTWHNGAGSGAFIFIDEFSIN